MENFVKETIDELVEEFEKNLKVKDEVTTKHEDLKGKIIKKAVEGDLKNIKYKDNRGKEKFINIETKLTMKGTAKKL